MTEEIKQRVNHEKDACNKISSASKTHKMKKYELYSLFDRHISTAKIDSNAASFYAIIAHRKGAWSIWNWSKRKSA